MFARLLVPLDGTVGAAAALVAARTLARATGAAITLVRVTSDHLGDSTEGDSRIQQVEDETRAAAEQLAQSDVRVDYLVRTEPIAESIVEAGQTRNADVIVMTTHGRTGLARTFAGSVSERVVAGSGRPVLLLKPGGKPLDRIGTLLVPVDGTAGGVLGLSTAVGLARATGARVMLLDVVPPMPMWMYTGEASVGSVAYFDPVWEEEALKSARAYVRGLGEHLRMSGLQVDTSAVRGDVAASIHAVADETDTDLVVMSTHALTGPARTVLGSVADAVVRTSHRPVLLVRRWSGTTDSGVDNASKPVAELATLDATSSSAG
jgi:nucleotide-binding universal stress UspA family protein